MFVGPTLNPDFQAAFAKLAMIPRPIKDMIVWKEFKIKFNEEWKVYNEIKDEILREHVEVDKNGDMVFLSGNAQIGGVPKIQDSKIASFNEKITELSNQKFKCIPVQIKLDALPETLKLSEVEFDLLTPFIDLREDAKEEIQEEK